MLGILAGGGRASCRRHRRVANQIRLTPVEIGGALGLDRIRQARNDIIHRGFREIPWPVADDPPKRDWPQILNDVVEEILRYRFHATPTNTVRKHVEEGLRRAGMASD